MNSTEKAAFERIKKAIQDYPELAAECIGDNLGSAIVRAQSIADELQAKSTDALVRYIRDEKIRDAVAAFNATMNITQEVFGEENMTEAVICKAIEAGSYIAYRSIMGEAAR